MKTIGLCIIIGIDAMQVFTYTFDSYELALEQAVELTRGVTDGRIERLPEEEGENGLRRRVFRFTAHHELIVVHETCVADEILPCQGALPHIWDMDR